MHAPTEALDPLPDLDANHLSPQLTGRLEPLLAALELEPGDAAAAGGTGILLQAYEQHGLAVPFFQRARALQPDELRWEYYLECIGTDVVRARAASARPQVPPRACIRPPQRNGRS